MSRETKLSPLSAVHQFVDPVVKALSTDGQLMVSRLRLPDHTKRHDITSSDPRAIAEGIIRDAEEDRKTLHIKTLFQNSLVNGAITVAASSHTPVMLETKIKKIPAHFVSWWWGKNGEKRNILDLTELPPEELENYLSIMTKGVTDSANYLRKRFKEEKKVDIYGLIGHVPPEERKKTGLGKGTQTNPHGHVNIVVHDSYDKATIGKATLNEAMKMIGPMDSILMKKWGGVFVELVENLLRKKEIEGSVSLEGRHKVDASMGSISYYDNLAISLSEAKPLKEVFQTLIPIVSMFKNIFNNIFSAFEKYYQDPNSDSFYSIRKEYFGRANQLGLSQEVAEEMFDFAYSFRPTLGQISSWLEENKTMTEEGRSRLEFIQQRYERIKSKLSGVKEFKELDWLLIGQMLGLTGKSMPEFVWSNVLSMVYRFDEFEIREGQIFIKKLSLSPRFFSNKGMLEHTTGRIVERKLPQ